MVVNCEIPPPPAPPDSVYDKVHIPAHKSGTLHIMHLTLP